MIKHTHIVAIALVLAVAGLVYAQHVLAPTEVADDAVACTMDGKLCPDGSTVGREGPDCAFASCPAEPVPEDVRVQIDAKSDTIQIIEPPAGSYITSPLRVTGEAQGRWYFEGDFPIALTNWDGEIIAEHYVMAQGDWMTEDFVPYAGELEFVSPYNIDDPEFMQRGWLILRRDNPTGLPEHDDAIEIPVWFAPPN